jgi:hypothetical protein
MAHEIALSKASKIKDSAIIEMEHSLLNEENRLKELRKINPVVRIDEIEAIETRIKVLKECYQNADVALDSIRIIF